MPSSKSTQEMAPSSQPINWMHIFLDHLLCLFVISPMVPTFWRGTWFLIGHFVFPDNPAAHGWVMFAIGNVAQIPFYLIQHKLVQWFGDPNPLVWLVVYHTFNYSFTLAGVCQWKGVWMLLDHYIGATLTNTLTWTAIGAGILLLLKCTKSIGETAPFGMGHDTTKTLLHTGTRFNQHQSGNLYHFFLDTLLTVSVINNLVVIFWRGFWGVLDLLLYPDDFQMTALVTTGIASGLAVGLYIIQFKVAAICARKSSSTCAELVKRLMLGIVILVGCMCSVAYWRGIWYLWDLYLWPEDPIKSNLLTHGLGYGVLMLLGVANSLCVRSYVRDKYIPGNPDKLYPIEFITYWLNGNDQVFFKHKTNENQSSCSDENTEVDNVSKSHI